MSRVCTLLLFAGRHCLSSTALERVRCPMCVLSLCDLSCVLCDMSHVVLWVFVGAVSTGAVNTLKCCLPYSKHIGPLKCCLFRHASHQHAHAPPAAGE